MRHILAASFLFAVLLTAFAACEKPPIYDPQPQITYVNYKSDTVQQNTGVATFIIGFTDGDGDLGSDSNGVSNLLIIDTRREDTFFYRVPVIPKQGAADGISGEIEVDIAQICCQDPDFPINCLPLPDVYQQAAFRVVLQDNAGQWSNEALTPALTIKCFE